MEAATNKEIAEILTNDELVQMLMASVTHGQTTLYLNDEIVDVDCDGREWTMAEVLKAKAAIAADPEAEDAPFEDTDEDEEEI